MTGSVQLNDGVTFPLIGLGVMQIADDQTPRAVREAVEIGYRSFDTAPIYGNEPGTGPGIRECGLPREQVKVTTKLWNSDQASDDALRACDESLKRMGLDYIDVFLIHWPAPALDKYVEAWKALVRLQTEGKVRTIGVSNFLEEHLERVVDATGVVPAMNQVECHPSWQRRDLRRTHERLGIATVAWSPLGRGGTLADPRVKEIAERLGISPARLVLAWLMRQDVLVIPKASSAAHMEDNFAAVGLGIPAEAMAALDAMDLADGSMGIDPLTFNMTSTPLAGQ